MNTSPNNPERNDFLGKSQEKIEKAKKDITWRVIETLHESGKEVVETAKNNEKEHTAEDLSVLKNSVAPKNTKINWGKYNSNHDHKRIEQELANTSTGEFLRNIHDQLRKQNIGDQYLHLLEGSDFMV